MTGGPRRSKPIAALLRRAWSDHRGVEVGTEGDGFFVVFDAAADAVAAAVAAKQALASHAAG